jgi:CDP-diglyceride synthetase
MLIAAMHHAGLTTALDDRHFGLLTLIVLMWLFWFWFAMRAERNRSGRGRGVVIIAGLAILILLPFSPWIALGGVQWVLAASLGVAWQRHSRRDL